MCTVAVVAQTQDFKIRYTSISRLFILPKSSTPHTLVVVGLDPPIRKGQTYYSYLLCQVWLKGPLRSAHTQIQPYLGPTSCHCLLAQRWVMRELYYVISRLLTGTWRPVTQTRGVSGFRMWFLCWCWPAVMQFNNEDELSMELTISDELLAQKNEKVSEWGQHCYADASLVMVRTTRLIVAPLRQL